MPLEPLMLASISEFFQSWGFWICIGAVAIVTTVTAAITSTMKHNATERTRREVAAYIAEGTMTPEQGERILTARVRGSEEC